MDWKIAYVYSVGFVCALLVILCLCYYVSETNKVEFAEETKQEESRQEAGYFEFKGNTEGLKQLIREILSEGMVIGGQIVSYPEEKKDEKATDGSVFNRVRVWEPK